jgi:hypothetical protein
MSVSADAQGDFARTSGSWANQLRLASLNMDTLAASLGAKLTPALTNVLQTFNQVAQESGGDLEVFIKNFDKVIVAGIEAADEILPVITSLAQQILNGLVKILPKLLDMGADIVSNLIDSIIEAIPQLAVALGEISGKLAAMFVKLVASIFNSFPQIIGGLFAGLFGMGDKFQEAIDTPLKKTISYIKELAAEADDLKESIEKTSDTLEDNINQTEGNAEAAKKLTDELFAMSDIERRSNDGKIKAKSLISQLSSIYPELGLTIDDVTGKLNMNREAVYKSIDAMKAQAEAAAYTQSLTDAYKDLHEAQKNQKDSQVEYDALLKQISTDTGESIQQIEDRIANMSASQLGSLYNADIGQMFVSLQKIKQATDSYGDSAIQSQGNIDSWSGALDSLGAVAKKAGNDVDTANSQYLASLQDWNSKIESAQQQHEDTMGSIYDYGLKKQKITLWQAAKNIAKQVSDMIAYKKNMKTLQGMAESGKISKEVYDQLAGEGTKAAGVIADLVKNPNSKAAQALLGALQGKANLNRETAIETVGARPVDPWIMQHASSGYRPYQSPGLRNFTAQTELNPNVAAAMQAAGVYPAPSAPKEQALKVDVDSLAKAMRKGLPKVVIDFVAKSVLNVDSATLAQVVTEAQREANLATGEAD